MARVLEVRCSDVHPRPYGCDRLLRAANIDDVIHAVCEHGTHEHGFPAAFYGPWKRELIAGEVRPSLGYS
jgi:predicted small metal-binding protein